MDRLKKLLCTLCVTLSMFLLYACNDSSEGDPAGQTYISAPITKEVYVDPPEKQHKFITFVFEFENTSDTDFVCYVDDRIAFTINMGEKVNKVVTLPDQSSEFKCVPIPYGVEDPYTGEVVESIPHQPMGNYSIYNVGGDPNYGY